MPQGSNHACYAHPQQTTERNKSTGLRFLSSIMYDVVWQDGRKKGILST